MKLVAREGKKQILGAGFSKIDFDDEARAGADELFDDAFTEGVVLNNVALAVARLLGRLLLHDFELARAAEGHAVARSHRGRAPVGR